MHPVISFRERFCKALANPPDLSALTRLVHFRMNVELARVVLVADTFDNVVYAFVRWTERHGRFAELVQVVAEEFPHRTDLQALRAESVKAVPAADRLPATSPEEFAEEFRRRRCYLRHMNAYKQLHDILHELDGYLPQVRQEAEAREKARTPIPQATTVVLRAWAEAADTKAEETEFRNAPPPWVKQFRTNIEDFLGNNAERQSRALARIAILPGQELRPLNRQLADCARRLGVANLVGLLDDMLLTTDGLNTAAARFRAACVSLIALTQDHDLCQLIDTEFRLAKGAAPESSKAMLGWDEVVDWLSELSERRPGDHRVARTWKAANSFRQVPNADMFQDLMEKFDDLFKKIDEALLTVTSQLLLAAIEMEDALGGLR